MLNLLLNLSDGVEQVLVGAGEKLGRLCRGGCTNLEQCWLSEDHQTMLGLYIRQVTESMNEAGVFYGAGPACEDWKHFPSRLLRLFSHDEKCIETAQSYFADLVQEHNFHEIGIARNVRPL